MPTAIARIALLVCALQIAAAEPQPGACLWTFVPPAGRIQNIVYPIVSQDRAFLINDNSSKGSNFVYALDLKSGAILWQTDLGPVICAEPALAGNRLIVTSTVQLRDSTTFCLDATTGKILWQRQHGEWLTANMGMPFRLVICGPYAVMVSMRHKGPVDLISPGYSRLLCLELTDGYPVWNANEEDTGLFSRLSEPADGRVYFGMTKVDAHGHVQSEHIYSFMPSMGAFRDEFTQPEVEALNIPLNWMGQVVADGKLFVQQNYEPWASIRTLPVRAENDKTAPPPPGMLYCYDLATKKKIWSIPSEATWRLPQVHEGQVVIASQSGFVVCLNAANGHELWHRYVDTLLDEPLVHNGQVLVATRQLVTALRLDNGAKLWEFDAPKPALDGRPCAAGDIVPVPAAFTRERISLFALKLAEKLPPK